MDSSSAHGACLHEVLWCETSLVHVLGRGNDKGYFGGKTKMSQNAYSQWWCLRSPFLVLLRYDLTVGGGGMNRYKDGLCCFATVFFKCLYTYSRLACLRGEVRVSKWKDTSEHHLIWSRWPGSSAQGQRPKQWAGKGIHGAPSARQTHKTMFFSARDLVLFRFQLKRCFLKIKVHFVKSVTFT